MAAERRTPAHQGQPLPLLYPLAQLLQRPALRRAVAVALGEPLAVQGDGLIAAVLPGGERVAEDAEIQAVFRLVRGLAAHVDEGVARWHGGQLAGVSDEDSGHSWASRAARRLSTFKWKTRSR